MNDKLTLESLPNEVFQELFEYFDTYELYKIFSALNFRIDSLITNFKYLQVILDTPDAIDYAVNRYFLPKTQILIINHTKSLCDPINVKLLSHIRSLTLCQPTREQWNSIQPSLFPYLERLHIMNSRFAYRTERLCQLVFSNEFPNLYSCSLPHVAYESNNRWSHSFNIRSLEINIWDIRVYTRILAACPNINRLRMQINGGHTQENILLTNLIERHSALRQLAIYLSSPTTCDFIDSVLSFVPNLAYFLLASTY